MTTLNDSRPGVTCLRRPGEPVAVEVPPLTGLGDCLRWLRQERSGIRQALDEHGALYLAGLPIHDAQDFAEVRDVLVAERASYKEKATPRSALGDDVFSSTDLPSSQAIRPHNENSYTLTFPGVLMFCCLTAPLAGGATPVTDCRRVLANLPPELVARFREHGWLLNRVYSEHISLGWRAAFGADSRAEVAAYCAAQRVGHQWLDDDRLFTTQLRPALIRHPRTGEEVWFNHVAFWNEWSLDPDVRDVLLAEFGPDGLPFATALGDGSRLGGADVAAINDAYEAATVRREWSRGDVLLVDNVLAAHGRDPFRGDRKIVVAMGEPTPVETCRPAVVPAAGPPR
ncbi:TauD/TfdA family dioxygenase [Sphaerisporangium rubeum]|uniref:Alpha-ketoglutarate-dependent taurine dioxygenase n=1 Tax=Sphaerisporangium rubeum TaxID=321317 RepID=A0A7X0IK81_9ACTN|nr:TauD/TfdA family dioxygenase [Sphaerisporangium rubeum]MBB6476730.1 alpha-ketoglutarate-dependent taurine dioxygenase [Sphaerisporangium rubeum]